ncbi:hypothetical protein ACHAWF_016101 [Thalassiosira exigua]
MCSICHGPGRDSAEMKRDRGPPPRWNSTAKKREPTSNDGLVSVRPDVEVDPIWEEYAEEARTLWRKEHRDSRRSSRGTFSLGNMFNSNAMTDGRSVRYRKDSDIIDADASELPLCEKVHLLVNRILNDKTSLPGYQYRYLVLKHKQRTTLGDEAEAEKREESPLRSSRQDAHGIIKHVTATLLEGRPGLASSSAMTELCASAVEVLVFAELYDDAFGEKVQTKEEKDECLLGEVNMPSVSQSAIAALNALPQARTPTDKVERIVKFLEHVSDHFSALFEGRHVDADTLLNMVCQHVVAANVRHFHAEVAFIEEFSGDKRLMSGKEGYALTTLQASIHYLDSLKELP